MCDFHDFVLKFNAWEWSFYWTSKLSAFRQWRKLFGNDQVSFFTGRQTSELLIGISVLTKAALTIFWTIAVRFHTLIKTLIPYTLIVIGLWPFCIFLLLLDHCWPLDQCQVMFWCLPFGEIKPLHEIATYMAFFNKLAIGSQPILVLTLILIILCYWSSCWTAQGSGFLIYKNAGVWWCFLTSFPALKCYHFIGSNEIILSTGWTQGLIM